MRWIDAAAHYPGNVREPDQLVGDVYALATCNEIGHRRLTEMMDEFDLADLEEIAAFILDNSRRATLEKINALEPGQAAERCGSTATATRSGWPYLSALKTTASAPILPGLGP